MRNRRRAQKSLLDRAAKVAFTFVVMNTAAVAGLVAAFFSRKVWR